tara:strand:+ start:568 stop:723 length:156 start_codon:yes stop_codon:yes gene_type:complete
MSRLKSILTAPGLTKPTANAPTKAVDLAKRLAETNTMGTKRFKIEFLKNLK